MKKLLDFAKSNGLVPVIIQEEKTRQVLMLGYMNKSAYVKTQETGWVFFWSRSKNRLWMKGETSGDKLKVKKIFVDCDRDTLLIQAELVGDYVCHKNTKSCFSTMNYYPIKLSGR